MPRPPVRRHAANSKHLPARVESKKSTQSRQQLERKLANKPIGQRPADSDDSDRLVTRTPSARNRNSSLRSEIFASGAIGKGDKPGAYPTRAERRRNLHNDTAQILHDSRSRSHSAATSTSTRSSPRPAHCQSTHARSDSISKPLADADVPKTAVKPSRTDAAIRLHRTPLGESSILGTLKPRKRQASILHLIDNEDSSLINPEDEEQFLPDDESTPLHKGGQPSISADQRSSQPSATTSRKRKRDADLPNSVLQATLSTPTCASPSGNRHLPTPHGSQLSQRPSRQSNPNGVHSITSQEDSNIMALPQSSSPESTPPPRSPRLSPRASPVIPSTQQLQSLMPITRRKGTRDRKQVDKFDIPADTSSDLIEEGDESVYMPKKSSNKRIPTKKTVTNPRSRPNRSALRPSTNKSTTPASSHLPHALLRSPMPLTTSSNAENRKLRSPSPQHLQNILSEDLSYKRNGEPRKEAMAYEKQSGGSHRRNTRQTRGFHAGLAVEASQDQENRDIVDSFAPLPTGSVSISSTKHKNIATSNLSDPLDPAEESEFANANAVDLDEVLPEVIHADHDVTAKIRGAKTWKSRWADIDNWSLDYEEVDSSPRSDSPMRR